ncbi:MAG: hypothetical protein C0594_13130 [Marinilabiliales bacterium]|nr:MAG: hypothetical protein C0594_13130 [Marinilabiliales bacterium]
MKPVFHSTVLYVSNIDASRNFYEKVIGLIAIQDFGKSVSYLSGISLYEIQANHKLSSRISNNKDNNAFELYFECENIEEVYNVHRNNNTRFLHPIEEESWGQKTFRIYDPDDNIIAFGESLDISVKRMHSEGYNIDQICDKTSIEKAAIESILDS